MKVVILDNYDSFTWNLYQRVGELGAEPEVFRNDAVSVAQLRALAPDRIIISPGPGRPENPAYFGVCGEVIRQLGPEIPLLGVCLGHLGIISEFGGRVVPAPAPCHGKTSLLEHDGEGVFQGLPSRIEVMRYHSLIGEESSLPACLRISARSTDGVLMGVRHRHWPLEGVQFHPESIGTEDGRAMLQTFVRRSRFSGG